MLGGSRPRRALALATCVLWLLAVEVLPNLHLAEHDHHHTHAADGTIIQLPAAEAALDADDHDDDDDDGDPSQAALDHAPLGHAAGGIAHRIAALHQPPAPLLAPIDVARMVWRVAAAPRTAVYRIGIARPTARGPPSV